MSTRKRRKPNRSAAQLVEYARDRLIDLAPRPCIIAELRTQGARKDRAPGYVDAAERSIERAFDGEDVQRIREAAIAGASDRVRVCRIRVRQLLQEINELSGEIEDGDKLPVEALHKLKAQRSRIRMAIDRTIVMYLGTEHRSHRDFIVALIPKETRQDTREPTDEEIKEALLKAL